MSNSHIKFTHVALGATKNVAIAHIYKKENPTEIYEYALVRYPDTDKNSQWYGTWSHSLGYYTVLAYPTSCHAYEDVKKAFEAYMKK